MAVPETGQRFANYVGGGTPPRLSLFWGRSLGISCTANLAGRHIGLGKNCRWPEKSAQQGSAAVPSPEHKMNVKEEQLELPCF